MFRKRPPRLADSLYQGFQRYFLTTCTDHRHAAFSDRLVAEAGILQLHQSASRHDIAVIAYCFMPDHVHALVEGESEAADFRKFTAHFKQMTGYAYRRTRGRRLWQKGFFDRILRNSEPSDRFVGYILDDPVRAGLVSNRGDFPFAGAMRRR